MLTMSEADLRFEAKSKGYRPEILEKVYHLLILLTDLMQVPYLSDRLALKGGTAINLFCSDQFRRLSVDLDFNYIGSPDREVMQKERIELERILFSICKQRQFLIQRNPSHHAGGKSVLSFKSVTGNKGRLEIDLNYLYRVPLWNPLWSKSPQWPLQTTCRILDIHELAAGKLNALLGRKVSRDLFDSHQLLTKWPLDKDKMRLAFTIYAAMRKEDWQQISVDHVQFSIKDIKDKLIPVLKNTEIPSSHSELEFWAKSILDQCKDNLSMLLPFHKSEIDFLVSVQHYGVIRPEILTDDLALCAKIIQHPILKWRAQQANGRLH